MLANERIARFIYNRYQSDMGDSDRTRLPAYSEMKKTMVENCIKTLPPLMVEILKAKIQTEQAEAAEEQAGPLLKQPEGAAL